PPHQHRASVHRRERTSHRTAKHLTVPDQLILAGATPVAIPAEFGVTLNMPRYAQQGQAVPVPCGRCGRGKRWRLMADAGDPTPEEFTLDTSVAHPARVYDYWLGGKDNFAADPPGWAASLKAVSSLCGLRVGFGAGGIGLQLP